jgi:hypothetical protein
MDEGIAVGISGFCRGNKKDNGGNAIGTECIEAGESYQLREPSIGVWHNLRVKQKKKKRHDRAQNTYFWNVNY